MLPVSSDFTWGGGGKWSISAAEAACHLGLVFCCSKAPSVGFCCQGTQLPAAFPASLSPSFLQQQPLWVEQFAQAALGCSQVLWGSWWATACSLLALTCFLGLFHFAVQGLGLFEALALCCFPPPQELFRKVRSILNKLTPQMFNQLMKQVTDLTVDTEERLKGVIDLVFEKAIDEPSFSVAYANMCRCLVTVRLVCVWEHSEKSAYLF